MKIFFQHPTLDAQLLRVISHTYYGAADIGECLATAHRIPEGDFDAWHNEWVETANARFKEGEMAEKRGQKVSASQCYLRASNYYRVATFFDQRPASKERLSRTFALHQEAFKRAMRNTLEPSKPIEIPYYGRTLPGYFHKADSSKKPRPTIIFCSGEGSCHAEAYFNFIPAAKKRGYHALAFDGPGQGDMLINKGTPMRYDWEAVITPVIDYLETRKEVDMSKIILLGQSLGGLLAPRAAAFERRVAALVVNPGHYDAMENLKKVAVGSEEGLCKSSQSYHQTLEAFLQAAMQDKFVAAKFLAKMFTHGVDTPKQLFEEWEKYSLVSIAKNIQCPTLVCDSENDHLASPQAEMLYEALTCPKEYLMFTNCEGGGNACAAGASALFSYRIFDWLDRALTQPKKGMSFKELTTLSVNR